MKTLAGILLLTACLSASATAQNAAPQEPTLRVTSRAVVLDVIVTKDGKPVKDLPQNAFTVTEQGKSQTISFFEEHHAAQSVSAVPAPKLPPNVFSNFSAYPLPPAVNVVLLDSLNTRMDRQSWVHDQALKFLQNAKPGTQTAIFTMGLGLHFIQGFTGDPALLVAALKNKKNNNVEQSVMLKGQEESNTEANLIGMMSEQGPGGGPVASPEAIAALSNFFAENAVSREFDRSFLTLENLQRLATFLNSFPGRKNVIWFAQSVPAAFVNGVIGPQTNPAEEKELQKTMDMLAAARVALYPVDARGLVGNSIYQAESVLPHQTNAPQMMGAFNNNLSADDRQRNADQESMDEIAEQTGGRAFKNTNGLGQVMDAIAATTSDFYTLSYSPINEKMDNSFRTIEIKVTGGNYKLTYRRGYFALDEGLPGGALETREQALHAYQQKQGGQVDPLLPFMDLGMPMSDQILYEAKVTPQPPVASGADSGKLRYGLDFAIDLKDLKLKPDSAGVRTGMLNITLVVYDRYGNIVSHEAHIAALNIKPDVYPLFQTRGLQLHADIATPKGNYWLRTGIYDANSHKVGTLEISLAAVRPVETAAGPVAK